MNGYNVIFDQDAMQVGFAPSECHYSKSTRSSTGGGGDMRGSISGVTGVTGGAGGDGTGALLSGPVIGLKPSLGNGITSAGSVGGLPESASVGVLSKRLVGYDACSVQLLQACSASCDRLLGINSTLSSAASGLSTAPMSVSVQNIVGRVEGEQVSG